MLRVHSIKASPSGFGEYELSNEYMQYDMKYDEYLEYMENNSDCRMSLNRDEVNERLKRIDGHLRNQGDGILVGWYDPIMDEIIIECVFEIED